MIVRADSEWFFIYEIKIVHAYFALNDWILLNQSWDSHLFFNLNFLLLVLHLDRFQVWFS